MRIYSDGADKEALKRWLATAPQGVHIGSAAEAEMESILNDRHRTWLQVADKLGLTVWTIDIRTLTVHWSDGQRELLDNGVSKRQTFSDMEALLENRTKRFLSPYKEQLKVLVRNLVAEGTPFVYEVCVHTLPETSAGLPDGEPRWLRIRGLPEYNSRGQLVRAMGTVLNITEEKRQEQARAETYRNYRALLDGVESMFVLVSADYKVLALNRVAEDYTASLLGKGLKEGDDVLTVGNSDRVQKFAANCERALLGQSIEGRVPVHFTNGVKRHIAISYRPAYDGDGNIFAVSISAQDVTEEERYKELLELRVDRLSRIFEAIPYGSLIMQGDALTMNRAAELLTGYMRSELTDRSSFFEKMGARWESMIRFFTRNKPYSIQNRELRIPLTRKDGSQRTFSFTATAVVDDLVICLFQDITKDYDSRQQLRESEQRFRNLADSAPVLVWMSDPNKSLIYLNETWLKFRGRTLVKELGYGWAEGVHPEDKPLCLNHYEENFDLRQSFEMEYRLMHYSGEYRWVLNRGAPRFTADGKFLGYVGTCTDIDPQKKAQAKLMRLSEVVRLTSNAVVITDKLGHTQWVNQAFQHQTGYTEQEVLGKRPYDVLAGPDTAATEESIAHLEAGIASEKPFTLVFKNYRKNGDPYDVNLVITPFFEKSELAGYITVATDISEIVALNENLAEREKELTFFKDALDSSAMVAILDATGMITYANDALCAFTNTKPSDLNGSTALVSEKYWTAIMKQVLRGKTWKGEVQNSWPNGTKFWLSTTVVPFFDGAGRLTRMIAISQDISARKQLEAELKAQDQRISAAVVSAQDRERTRFATELHDSLGMLLSAAKMNLNGAEQSLLEQQVAVPSSALVAQQLLDQAIQETRNISHNLIPQHMSIQGLSDSLQTLCKQIAESKQLHISYTLNPEINHLSEAVALSVYRMAQELLANVVKHAKATHVQIVAGMSDGKFKMVVEDNGVGLPASIAQGGIGLDNIAFRVRALGGELTTESVPDKFTRFIVAFEEHADMAVVE